MKKAFLTRGFHLGTSAADTDFRDVRETVERCGYEVAPVPFTWNRKTMTRYVEEFVRFYEQHKGTQNIIIGHSFGAVAALASTKSLRPDLLVLCSLSACFKEDLPEQDARNGLMKRMRQRRRKDFGRFTGKKLA